VPGTVLRGTADQVWLLSCELKPVDCSKALQALKCWGHGGLIVTSSLHTHLQQRRNQSLRCTFAIVGIACSSSPWPGVDQLQREVLRQTSSSFGGPQAAAALAAALAAAANAADAAAAGAAQLGSLVGHHDVLGSDYGGQFAAPDADAAAGGAEAAEERSRAIAEQLAQLHVRSGMHAAAWSLD
jgi:hypothetical protein